MSDLKETIVESIKSLLLPEIRKLQEGQNEIRTSQDALEKQLSIMNENILGNSRRIDETNKRIDETNKRIDETKDYILSRLDETNKRIDETKDYILSRLDETNKRIDFLHIEMGNVGKEMERIKRGEAITSDILHRMEVLEGKVLLGR